MAHKLAVLVIHGMGDQSADFAEDMIEELHDRIDDHGSDPEEIYWKPVWWAPALAGTQDELLRRLSLNNDLDYRKLRRFIVNALGDAIAYQEVPPDRERLDIYKDIHNRVATAVQDARDHVHDGLAAGAKERPLLVMAHSLGCHIISNFIWDRQKDPASTDNSFEGMQTLAGMVTFGCNIPLWSLAYTKLVPIEFPAGKVKQSFPDGTTQETIDRVCQWLNFYDPDDILGYPLKPLSPEYDDAVNADLSINVGGLFNSWNPLSHNKYWTDNSFTKPVATMIHELVKALPSV